jgi:uncharacterized membrane-anchored protein
MKNLLKISTATLTLTPFFTFAQTDAQSILSEGGTLLTIILRLLFAAALVIFVYGVIRYVISSDADEKVSARDVVVKGLIGLFVIVSVWGLVGVIQATLDIGSGGNVGSDQIPGVDLRI